jgi:hypothetical protein
MTDISSIAHDEDTLRGALASRNPEVAALTRDKFMDDLQSVPKDQSTKIMDEIYKKDLSAGITQLLTLDGSGDLKLRPDAQQKFDEIERVSPGLVARGHLDFAWGKRDQKEPDSVPFGGSVEANAAADAANMFKSSAGLQAFEKHLRQAHDVGTAGPTEYARAVNEKLAAQHDPDHIELSWQSTALPSELNPGHYGAFKIVGSLANPGDISF